MKRDYRRSRRGRKRSSLAQQLRQLAMLAAMRWASLRVSILVLRLRT
jgi:hypothetical protein